jgi:hypothetical protein
VVQRWAGQGIFQVLVTIVLWSKHWSEEANEEKAADENERDNGQLLASQSAKRYSQWPMR